MLLYFISVETIVLGVILTPAPISTLVMNEPLFITMIASSLIITFVINIIFLWIDFVEKFIRIVLYFLKDCIGFVHDSHYFINK